PYTAALLASVPEPGRPLPAAGLVAAEQPSPLAPPSGCRFRTRCPLADEQCARQEPPLTPIGEGRAVACHRPLGGSARSGT
ncbi:peptide ABC transporter ATP-binding protein, partial [Catenulispora sp. NL8]|nr:peptide ABC transporter ATP-binding protein [Catenulispora pinistramenti]